MKNIICPFSDKLNNWLDDIILCEFDIVVGITRRCTNFLEFIRLSCDREDYCDFLSNVITENALLILAEKIAQEYSSGKGFPKIGLLDDILVHGRSLNLFLQTFYDTFYEFLSIYTKSELNDDVIQEDFFHNITICVFAMNNSPVLIKDEYKWGMHYGSICSENEWRGISRWISDTIWNSEISNTSFVLSAFTDRKALSKSRARNSDMWYDESGVRYRERMQHLYIHKSSFKKDFCSCIRVYQSQEKYIIAPYLFLKEMDFQEICILENWIVNKLKEKQMEYLDRLKELLAYAKKTTHLYAVYYQLIELMFSQIVLNIFLDDFSVSVSEVSFDTEKIARNFGERSRFKPVLEQLCILSWSKIELEEVSDMISPFTPINYENELVSENQMIECIEKIVYEAAVKHENKAKQIESIYFLGGEVSSSSLSATGEISTTTFIHEISKRIVLKAWDRKYIQMMLSCLTQMMDCGDVSLKSRYLKEGTVGVFYSVVRVTDMSLAIMPRKMGDNFDDFCRIVRFYWRDNDLSERTRVYFDRLLLVSQEDKERILEIAVYMANLMTENRRAIGSMLNWIKPLQKDWDWDNNTVT